MTCNIVFDYVDSHKSEYWYKCTHCGARDWFAHYGRPSLDKPIGECKAKDAEHMRKFNELRDLQDMTREQLIGQIMIYRKRIEELEEKQYD